MGRLHYAFGSSARWSPGVPKHVADKSNAVNATAEFTEGEPKGGETNQPNLILKFSYLNGATRSEVDMSEWQARGGHLGISMNDIREDMRNDC